MDEQRIIELEEKLLEFEKELKSLRNQSLRPRSLKDGEWIHLTVHGISYVVKHKKTDKSYAGAYLAYKESQKESKIINPTIFYENSNNFFDYDGLIYKIRFATLEEVQNALLKFAEYKGFKEGVNFKCASSSDKISTLKGGIINYNYNLLSFDTDAEIERNLVIYNDKTNQWAEIVQEYNAHEIYKDGEWLYLKDKTNTQYIFNFDNKPGFHNIRFVDANFGMAIDFFGKKTCFGKKGNLCFLTPNNLEFRKATHDEIKDALRELTKDKGFIDGASYKPLVLFKTLSNHLSVSLSRITKTVNYAAGHPTIRFSEGKYYVLPITPDDEEQEFIYYDGQWAEFIKPFEIIPGYPVKYMSNDICKINGLQYKRRDILSLLNGLEGINGPNESQKVIHTLNVGCSAQFKISTQDLRNLISHWP